MNMRKAHITLFLNTLAFTVCFACWTLNGVVATFLTENQLFDWKPAQVGWLLGITVLSGSIFRLPAGMLTDWFGGKYVYGFLMILCAIPLYLLSIANNFTTFAVLSFCFGLVGASFAIGVAFTSVWYSKERQGTALGIFGLGNIGASFTTLFAPHFLNKLTNYGSNLEGWRTLPQIYAFALLTIGIIFLIFTENKKPEKKNLTMIDMLLPLKNIRVWRFGLYYFLTFGGFVAFSQWLLSYYVNVYTLPLVTAGLYASCFSFPSALIRPFGGWLSDKLGARRIIYLIFNLSVLISFMLCFPKMEILTPGKGIMAKNSGTITYVSDSFIKVNEDEYKLLPKIDSFKLKDSEMLILPKKTVWQESVVKVNDKVKGKELLAKGVTKITFQANIWINLTLVVLLGIGWGIGNAAVYKYIPQYFPAQVGVVGGTVGLIGGLGGFFLPVIFGSILEWTGIWTTCWMLILILSTICLTWLSIVITAIADKETPSSNNCDD